MVRTPIMISHISDQAFSILVILLLWIIFIKNDQRTSKYLSILSDKFQGILQKLKINKQVLIPLLLILTAELIIFQIWGTATTPGDDAAFSTDRFQNNGILDSVMKLSIYEGRFYFTLALPLSEFLYVFDSFVLINIVKIITNSLIFFSFYLLAKELFGISIAVFSCFIGLAFFDTYGEAINPFFSFPLYYGLGALIQITSFWLYTKACKVNKGYVLPTFLFFFSLIFYEIFIFYTLGYFLIYYYFNSSGIKSEDLSKWVKKALIRNTGLFVSVFVYLSAYIIFRQTYPSDYAGSKVLTFGSPLTIIKTISLLSLTGLQWDFLHMNLTDYLRSFFVTLLIAIGLAVSFSKNFDQESESTKQKRTNSKVIYSLFFFVLSPNLLHGLLDKYRQLAEGSTHPYYLGSYYSSFALILIMGIFLNSYWSKIKDLPDRKHKFKRNIILIISVFALSNISNASRYHSMARLQALRWPLIIEALNKARELKVPYQNLCSTSFEIPPENTYNYWKLYLSHLFNNEITFSYLNKGSGDTSKCNLFVDFLYDQPNKSVEIKISTPDDKLLFIKQLSI